MPEGTIDRDAALCLVKAWLCAVDGRPEECEVFLSRAEGLPHEGSLPDGTASVEAGVATLRAVFETYAVAFKGMQMEAKNGNTILTGKIIDQPQLYGILCRLNGLGLELLSVEVLPEAAHPGTEGNREQEESEP